LIPEERHPLLEVANLRTYLPVTGSASIPLLTKQEYVKAVDGVSLRVERGETVAVVGESGCGKTTLARSILGLVRGANISGSIKIEGQEQITKGRRPKDRFKTVQMVFQDPDSSLDPTMKINDTVTEPLVGLTNLSKQKRDKKVVEALRAVGLGEEFSNRLPRQLSGGQKQRVSIARAMVTGPKLMVLDEPTSALDASVQAQILNLLIDLQQKFKLSYLIITHNVAVAEYLSDRTYVMYAGKVVEHGPTKTVITRPTHPYTITLIASAPMPNPRKRSILDIEVAGEVPSALNPPSGCRFHPRCAYAENKCELGEPVLQALTSQHYAACHFVSKTTKNYPLEESRESI